MLLLLLLLLLLSLNWSQKHEDFIHHIRCLNRFAWELTSVLVEDGNKKIITKHWQVLWQYSFILDAYRFLQVSY